MRLLYFSRDYTTHDHRFLTALAQTGHEIFFLRLEKGSTPLEDRPLPPEITMVSWAGGHGPFSWGQVPRLLANFRRVLGEVKPDLVHAGPIQTAGLLSALSGFHPLVVASWGYDLLLDSERNRLWRYLTRHTLSRADVFVGDCDTIRNLAVGYGVPDARIVTFPWGIDLQAYTPAKSQSMLRSRLGWEDNFVLISTRGWEPIYGVEDLATAFVRAARHHPDLRLLMLGAGSQARQLRQIFMRGGVQDYVHFPGQISQRELPDYFRSADVYLSASRSDGTSISLLEALATGKPALVSDIPGNREWITPGENGWLFPLNDVEGLAEAIVQAVEAGEQLETMGHNARREAERRADWSKNFPELLRAYEMALGRHEL